jgi:hypothetical protein
MLVGVLLLLTASMYLLYGNCWFDTPGLATSETGTEDDHSLPFLRQLLEVTKTLKLKEHEPGRYPKSQLRALLPAIFQSKSFVDDHWEKKVLILKDLPWMIKVIGARGMA